MSASSDVNGSEASSAPANELRLASSLMATTSKAVIATLTNNASMTHLLEQLPVRYPACSTKSTATDPLHRCESTRIAPREQRLPERADDVDQRRATRCDRIRPSKAAARREPK